MEGRGTCTWRCTL